MTNPVTDAGHPTRLAVAQASAALAAVAAEPGERTYEMRVATDRLAYAIDRWQAAVLDWQETQQAAR